MTVDWRHPVIVRAGIVFFGCANKSQVFNACNVAWIRTVEEAIRIRLFVQRLQRAVGEHAVDEFFVLGIRAVTPLDSIRRRQLRNLVHPVAQCSECRR